MYTLGISAYFHDSAAALTHENKLIYAVQEERFSRKKHDANFPKQSIMYCLEEGKISPHEIDYIVFYEKPFLKFERLLETYLAFAPRGLTSFLKSMPIWLKDKLFQKENLIKLLKRHGEGENLRNKIFFSEHHLSHAASAYYPSPFNEAIILTADGVGEWATTTVAIGKENKVDILKEIHFPHSLGLLYSAFTYYIGFKVNSGEYKLMGLAPYGKPNYKDIIYKELIDIKNDGSFRLNQKYFNYSTGLTMTNKKFSNLFGENPRKPDQELNQFHMDIAASIQTVIEEIMVKICSSLKDEYKIKNLCLAGGVALNCVANGKIYKSNLFDNIWIQPASGDAGGSLGAALAYWHLELDKSKKTTKDDKMKGSYLGPSYKKGIIENTLNTLEAKYEVYETKDIIKKTAEELTEGKVIGWFHGKMEFGPRALGNRSIIADPRSNKMQKKLNLKIKFRESFRPFAPSVLRDHLSEWFELDIDSPYMMMVAKTNEQINIKMSSEEEELFGIEKLNIPRSSIPSVTHVDYSARIQTVHESTNLMYSNLIKEFFNLTRCPVLVNTSFNVRGEPIVNTPEDAFKCFMGTEMDILVIENFYLIKENQNQKKLKSYLDKFEKD